MKNQVYFFIFVLYFVSLAGSDVPLSSQLDDMQRDLASIVDMPLSKARKQALEGMRLKSHQQVVKIDHDLQNLKAKKNIAVQYLQTFAADQDFFITQSKLAQCGKLYVNVDAMMDVWYQDPFSLSPLEQACCADIATTEQRVQALQELVGSDQWRYFQQCKSVMKISDELAYCPVALHAHLEQELEVQKESVQKTVAFARKNYWTNLQYQAESFFVQQKKYVENLDQHCQQLSNHYENYQKIYQDIDALIQQDRLKQIQVWKKLYVQIQHKKVVDSAQRRKEQKESERMYNEEKSSRVVEQQEKARLLKLAQEQYQAQQQKLQEEKVKKELEKKEQQRKVNQDRQLAEFQKKEDERLKKEQEKAEKVAR